RRVNVDRERPCEGVHIELVGGVVEHPPYSHASVPGGVVDEHEHVYIRVFDGLLPPGTRAKQPHSLQFVSQADAQLFDEPVEQHPLVGSQRRLSQGGHGVNLGAMSQQRNSHSAPPSIATAAWARGPTSSSAVHNAPVPWSASSLPIPSPVATPSAPSRSVPGSPANGVEARSPVPRHLTVSSRLVHARRNRGV